MAFRNTTVYLVPVWFDDLSRFEKALHAMMRWETIDETELSTDYLLSYIHCITADHERFRAFRLRSHSTLELYMYEDKTAFSQTPVLEEVRLSCFGTGVGFMEFTITYGELSVSQIAEFAYRFKKALPNAARHDLNGKKTLYQVVCELLPESAIAFFECTADFKRECHCLHFLKTAAHGDEMEQALRCLRRSYNTEFGSEPLSDRNAYDMLYEPYAYDKWAGSQEALVNVVCDTGKPHTDYFINNYKYGQLMKDYRFLYLLLLNQRFSAIRYIAQIAEGEATFSADGDTLSKRIALLKTAYSFRVVSDDMLYQNVYSHMYEVLEIDRLLEDIQDNEARMMILQHARDAEKDRRTNAVLAAIAVLTLFSAAIDAASLFDRMGSAPMLSTIGALVIIFIVAGFCFHSLVTRRK